MTTEEKTETTEQCGTEIKQEYVLCTPELIAENVMISTMEDPLRIIVTLLKNNQPIGFLLMDPDRIDNMFTDMVRQIRAIKAASKRIITL